MNPKISKILAVLSLTGMIVTSYSTVHAASDVDTVKHGAPVVNGHVSMDITFGLENAGKVQTWLVNKQEGLGRKNGIAPSVRELEKKEMAVVRPATKESKLVKLSGSDKVQCDF